MGKSHYCHTMSKPILILEKAPFKFYRDEAGEYWIDMPGKRKTCYYEEFPILTQLVNEVMVMEKERLDKINKARGIK